MPYEAAKAMAGTFCYHIRYALVPLFGPDFVSLCYHPGDPAFGRMVISGDIVMHCTAVAQEFRGMEEDKLYSNESPFINSLSTTPLCAKLKLDWTPTPPNKTLRKLESYPESGYGTDTDTSERCPLFPDAKSEAAWRAAQLARCQRSSHSTVRDSPGTRWMLPTPKSNIAAGDYPRAKRSLSDLDEEYDDESSTERSSEYAVPSVKRRRSTLLTKEARAAYMLMQLHSADVGLELNEQVDDRIVSS